jgi:antitoxin component HigA of HigAB toxin-antitoxin module
MAKKIIRPLHSEADYDVVLNEIERYFKNEPKPGTPEGDRFDLLALIIEDYERRRWPIEPPDTIDAIRYRMETGGYTQADLGRLLGSLEFSLLQIPDPPCRDCAALPLSDVGFGFNAQYPRRDSPPASSWARRHDQ